MFLHELERRHGPDWLTDRAGLEHGVGIDRFTADFPHPESTCPLDLAAVNHCDAHAGNIQRLHPIRKRMGAVFLALEDHSADQS